MARPRQPPGPPGVGSERIRMDDISAEQHARPDDDYGPNHREPQIQPVFVSSTVSPPTMRQTKAILTNTQYVVNVEDRGNGRDACQQHRQCIQAEALKMCTEITVQGRKRGPRHHQQQVHHPPQLSLSKRTKH